MRENAKPRKLQIDNIFILQSFLYFLMFFSFLGVLLPHYDVSPINSTLQSMEFLSKFSHIWRVVHNYKIPEMWESGFLYIALG